MAGILKVDRVQSDSNLSFQIAGANVAYMNSTGLNITGGEIIAGGSTLRTTNGLIYANNGIKFPTTQVPSSDPNTLDDYEEGNWTPNVIVTYGTGAISGQSTQGTYTRIGNLVHIKFQIVSISYTGSPINMGVDGLPFTINSAAQNYSSGIAQNLSSGNMYQLEMLPGYAQINVIRSYTNGTAFTNQNVGFDGSATYFI